MKKICALCVFLMLVMIATPGVADTNIVLEHIEAEDISDPSWGLKVSEHSGSYGGMNSNPAIDGRLVTDDECDGDEYAYYTFTWEYGTAQILEICHLDGIADDSFTVETLWDPGFGNGDYSKTGYWVEIFNYVDECTVETWKTSEICLIGLGHWGDHGTGQMQIRIRLDGDYWSGYSLYGQLAIDWMELRGNGIEI